MRNKAYHQHEIFGEINAAIDILCEHNGFCTPTDVLRFLEMAECKETRSMVLSCAFHRNLFIVKSGRGFRIACS